ncbi:MAG: putative capsular polysaccharide synthesis family protein, partial [Microcoleaceae cyanobacterium]
MALTKFTIPIVLIIFKRPETTKKVLQILSQIKPEKLFVIADGPRTDQPGENLLCAETRQLVDTEVNWDCQVFTNYSPQNLGCRQRVISGLNWVFSQVEQAIILEDDCLPDLTFFPFCAELLAKYAEENSVMAIAGDNFQPRDYQNNYQSNYSYYFSLYPHCWGWATWRRAWQKLDEQLTDWPLLREKNWLKQKLTNPLAMQYWSKIFQNVYEGFNSWAYIWQYACWLHQGLT